MKKVFIAMAVAAAMFAVAACACCNNSNKAAEEATARANEAASKNGKDGVSPTVKVETISGGHKVTITDKDGDKVFNVMNGADGKDGATVDEVIAALPKYNGEVVDV